MRLPIQLSSLLLAVSVTTASQAAIIIGNLSAYTNDLGQSGTGSSIIGQQGSISGSYSGKAIGFTMASNAYTVDSLTLRLTNVTGATDAPSISIWTNNNTITPGSGNPGVVVGTFTNPGVFNGTTTTNYVFTPSSGITLGAGASYFIVVQQLTPYNPVNTDITFNWLNGGPNTSNTVTPTSTGGIATAPIGRFGNTTSNPTSFNQGSSQFNWFQLEGTAVIPEPSTYASLVGVAALGLVAYRRRRR